MKPLSSATLNGRIGVIAEDTDTYDVPELRCYGKVIPFIGWFWREVDFDQRITLGDCGSYVGFMENNKWDHPEWMVTEEQDAEIKRQLQVICRKPTNEALQQFFAYLQTCRKGVA